MADLRRVRDLTQYVLEREDTPDELRFETQEEYEAIIKEYAHSKDLTVKKVKYLMALIP